MSEQGAPGGPVSGAGDVQAPIDSNYTSYENLNNTLSSSPHANDQEDVSNKRKRQDLRPRSRVKRLRAFYNDDYRKLLNETVHDVVGGTPVEETEMLRPTQIGITWWSSQEKDVFFSALAKRGRDDCPRIAAAIGTKTELEVHVYLRLLQKASQEQHVFSPRDHLFDPCDTPAAFEVSHECCDMLELPADALSVLQQREEEKLEKKKFEKIWLLDEKTILAFNKRQGEGRDGTAEIVEYLPAAELLNPLSFVKLSKSVFMNSSAADDNWRSYCGPKESPSILYTAFSDFHRLATSVTKRLIQSALFFAMSRIRATTTSRYVPKSAVRQQDIYTALRVLGMQPNARSFWVGAARRCNLAVRDGHNDKDTNNKMLTHDEVERLMNQDVKDQTASYSEDSQAEDIVRVFDTTTPPLEADPDQSLSDSTSNFSLNAASTSPDSESSESPSEDESLASDPDASEEAQDTYAEAVDRQSSQREELRLRRMLGHEPPEYMKPEELHIPKRPKPERKVGDDLDDWRAWVDYAPEWETYEVPIPASSFFGRRRRGSSGGEMDRSRSYRSRARAGGSSGDDEMEDEEADSSANTSRTRPAGSVSVDGSDDGEESLSDSGGGDSV